MPESVSFDLDRTNRSALRGAAIVGVIFGVAPLVSVLGALVAGGHAPTTGVVLVLLFCTPLAAIGAACANAWAQAVRRGEDRLVIEAEGLRREAKSRGFAVPWSELAGIEVVATEAVPGDNPYR